MIFRRSRKEGPESPAPAEPQAPAAEPQHEAQPAAQEPVAGPSIITPEAVLEGNLVTEGELHIEGTVHGSVQAAVVVIGAQGAVHGHVVGEEVYIRGRVIGPICGVNVHIVAGGHVEGDILNQTIAIETGAFVDGKIRRTEDPIGEWQRMWFGDNYEQLTAPEQEVYGSGEDPLATLDLGTPEEIVPSAPASMDPRPADDNPYADLGGAGMEYGLADSSSETGPAAGGGSGEEAPAVPEGEAGQEHATDERKDSQDRP